MPRLSRALPPALFLVALLASGPPAEAQTARNGRILFQRKAQGFGVAVYSMNADGTGATPVSDNGDFDPDASRRTQRVVFCSTRDGVADEIYIMNADGSGQARLTNNTVNDHRPTISPDGTKIAFVSFLEFSLRPQIFLMNADGSGRRTLTTGEDGSSSDHPQWSPDGSKLVFISDRHHPAGEIYSMNADGSGVTRLSNNTAAETTPNWSPDGARIVYARSEAPTNGFQLYTMNAADGSNKVRLLLLSGHNTNPDWSPDGTKIAFVNEDGFEATREIYVVNSNGTSPTRLTLNNVSDESPSWQAGLVPLVISEFRLRGPGGTLDEFVELYNHGDAPVTVQTLDGSAGYALAASDGIPRFVVPNGTVITARGHFLGTNSVGYSLSDHPGAKTGLKPTATGDATYVADIADNKGIALFDTANPARFSAGRRIDAVGSTAETNALYREGAGYAPVTTFFSIEHSFYRDECGKGGSTTTLGPCPQTTPKDTHDNAADFVFVDVNGTNANAGQRLGAPGPQNLSAPVQNSRLPSTLVAPCAAASSSPNRVRDFTSDPDNNSTYGALTIRRRFTNNTGAPVTRLRFRIADVSTLPAPAGYADLRARSSSLEVVMNPCGPGTLLLQGTTLEQPPTQSEGGGFNSALSADIVTPATPLAPGASVDVQWRLGLEQTGTFKFLVNVEALP